MINKSFFLISFLVIGLNYFCFGQKNDSTTILLVGTMHKLPRMFTGNYKYIRNAIFHFKPEMICTEYIIPNDSISFRKYYGNDFMRKHDSILSKEKIVMKNVKDEIDSLQLLLSTHESIEARYLLANQYYYQKDFGNMALQNFIVFKTNKNGTLTDIQKQIVSKRYSLIQNNEYDKVVFPYCYENSINYVFPIDDHSYETEYNEFTNEWKRESNGELNKQQHAYFSKHKWNLMWAFFVGKGGKMVNSSLGQKFSYKIEANLFDSTVSKNYNLASKFWNKRNENMAENILSSVEKSNSKRIAVFVGASHIPFLKEYLEKKSSYRILTLPDIN